MITLIWTIATVFILCLCISSVSPTCTSSECDDGMLKRQLTASSAEMVSKYRDISSVLFDRKNSNLRQSKKSFGSSFDNVIENFLTLQSVLDLSVQRKQQVGNISWLNNMCMYFWSLTHRNRKSIKRMCEVGFGNGHSSTLFLTATNDVKSTMISFDLFLFDESSHSSGRHDMGQYLNTMGKSQKAAVDYINATFPGRFRISPGTSDYTIPNFIGDNPGYKCDLIYIDGCHELGPMLNDIQNFRKLATNNTIVLLDDFENDQVRRAIEAAVKVGYLHPMTECIEGEVLIDERFGHPGWTKLDPPGKRFCQTKFRFD